MVLETAHENGWEGERVYVRPKHFISCREAHFQRETLLFSVLLPSWIQPESTVGDQNLSHVL